MTTFSASFINLTVLLPLSRDCSYYISRRILAPLPVWLQKHTDIRVDGFTHSPVLWHQPRLANLTCTWSWKLCGFSACITGKWTQNEMTISPERNAVLLNIVRHFKAHKLLFSARFQHRPQYFAHISANWKTQTTLFLKKSRGTAAK
jgi:hypothetical protein